MARRFKIGLLLLLSIYFLGAIGYKFFSPATPFLDCLYMSVITVASVGFTEVINSANKPGLRVYMMTLIMLGVATHLYAVSILTAFVVEGDLSNYFWKRRMSRKIESMKGHYIVCGAGETGIRVIEELLKTKRPFVVIDPDEKAIAGLRQLKDVCVIQGDAYDEQILASAGVERASAAP